MYNNNTSKKLVLLGFIYMAQNLICYFTLGVFDFVYMYDQRISSSTLDFSDLTFSLKGIFGAVIYLIFVFGVFMLANAIILIYFHRLQAQLSATTKIIESLKQAIWAISVLFLTYTFIWIGILALNGFPEIFPDNFWRGLVLRLNPHHPLMLLGLLFGNIIFFFLYIPIKYLVVNNRHF